LVLTTEIRGVDSLESARCMSTRRTTWRVTSLASFDSAQKVTKGRQCFLGGKNVSKKLYVGNLSYEVTDANLEEMFGEFGSVRSAQVIQDRDTGRSKGFGFVEMEDSNSAEQAIRGLNEKDHGGRKLTVNEARPREERSGAGSGGGGGRGGYGRR
jgi:RNA recognition motif-containing protein